MPPFCEKHQCFFEPRNDLWMSSRCVKCETAPEVAPIQSAPDQEKLLNAHNWIVAHVEHDGEYYYQIDGRRHCSLTKLLSEYASSSNAATEKILADARLIADGEKLWMGVKWVDMRNRALEAGARVVEQESLLKAADDEVSHLTGEVRELRAERDRLLSKIRQLLDGDQIVEARLLVRAALVDPAKGDANG